MQKHNSVDAPDPALRNYQEIKISGVVGRDISNIPYQVKILYDIQPDMATKMFREIQKTIDPSINITEPHFKSMKENLLKICGKYTRGIPRKQPRGSVVIICIKLNRKVLTAIGHTVRMKDDNFNRVDARKIAFQRSLIALKQLITSFKKTNSLIMAIKSPNAEIDVSKGIYCTDYLLDALSYLQNRKFAKFVDEEIQYLREKLQK